MIVHLADDAGTDFVAPVEQLLLDLVLDDLAALFDDEDFLEADSELPDAFRLQRPRHADLVQSKSDLGGDLRCDAELAQRLPDVLIALAGCHDAVAGFGESMVTRLTLLARANAIAAKPL